MRSAPSVRSFAAAIVIALLACIGAAKAETSNYFAPYGDLKVHYRSAGVGEDTLIFIHGWACDSGVWRGQMDAFPDHRVIAIDLPGHGQSGKPRADYNVPSFARAIEAVMRDAKIARAVLIGHSLGAPVAREFYRLFPEKTIALVIVDGALRPMASTEQFEKMRDQLRTDYPQTSRRMVEGMLTPLRDEKLRDEIRSMTLATPDYVGISAMNALADKTLYRTDTINVPMLAVLAKSPFWAADTEQFLRSLAPQLEFHMLEDVSHFLMMERPSDFNALLRSFLAKQRKLAN